MIDHNPVIAIRRARFPLRSHLLAIAAMLLLGSSILLATSVRRMPLPQIVSAADAIVEGSVTGVRSYWEGKQILTEVTVRVERGYKGKEIPIRTFQQLGGRVTSPVPLSMNVPGAPVHRVGDRGFYFMESRPGSRHLLVGLWRGYIPIRKDERGDHLIFGGRRMTPGQFGEKVRRLILDQEDPPGSRDAPAGKSAGDPVRLSPGDPR